MSAKTTSLSLLLTGMAFLCASCSPVSLTRQDIVDASATALTEHKHYLNRLSEEMAGRYLGTPHWPTLNTYLSNMRSTGNATWTDRYGNSLLEYSLLELPGCDAPLVHLMLLAGVDPNLAERSTNLTPLHRAANANDYRMALRLIAFGARTDAQDKLNRTPADLTGHPQLRRLLINKQPIELLSEASINTWKKACAGDASAMFDIAEYYNAASGLHCADMSKWTKKEKANPNEQESVAWLEQAALLGHKDAQSELVNRKFQAGLQPVLRAPEELGDCTLTLTGRQKGCSKDKTYRMGQGTAMPKLKVFTWKPQGRLAEISFDGVGEHCAVHFNGTMYLKEREGNSFSFDVQGEMKGFDPKNFTAKPYSITITLNPES
jgi:TPR repeat protein